MKAPMALGESKGCIHVPVDISRIQVFLLCPLKCCKPHLGEQSNAWRAEHEVMALLLIQGPDSPIWPVQISQI